EPGTCGATRRKRRQESEIREDLMTLPMNTLRAAIVAAALAAPGLAAAQDLTVGMPTSPPNVVHMPVYLAQELGLYKKHGLKDVKIVSLAGGVYVYRAMLAGNLDIGMSPATVTAVARSKGSQTKNILANLLKYEASLI